MRGSHDHRYNITRLKSNLRETERNGECKMEIIRKQHDLDSNLEMELEIKSVNNVNKC
jgi:hypothetical protein